MTTFCINLTNKQVTEYHNFDALAFERINGQMYAVCADGVYLIGNGETLIDTDDGGEIYSQYKLGMDDFGDAALKRMTRADVGAEGNLTIQFMLDDEKFTIDYDATHLGGGMGNRKIKIGKGHRSRYWQPIIRNVAGANFEVDAIALEAMLTGRRAR